VNKIENLCKYKDRPEPAFKSKEKVGYIPLTFINRSRSNRPFRAKVSKQETLEGFTKLEPKVNYHRMYFALMNELEKDIKKDHYILDEKDDIVVFTIEGEKIIL